MGICFFDNFGWCRTRLTAQIKSEMTRQKTWQLVCSKQVRESKIPSSYFATSVYHLLSFRPSNSSKHGNMTLNIIVPHNMLDVKKLEMDSQGECSNESSDAINCSSEASDTSSSSPELVVVKVDKRRDGPILNTKPDSDRGLPFRTGRWTPDEKILFLYGLKMFGKGRWKKMSIYLPHRSLVQIKSHAQKVLKRQQAGENIFRRLEENRCEIDNLVMQAASQREALRMTNRNVNPACMKQRQQQKRLDVPLTKTITPISSSSSLSQTSDSSDIAGQTSDSSVLAAAALCQLSSIGGSWDRRDIALS